MSIKACLSTGKDDWETPDDLFTTLNDKYHFVLDAAANETNHKCETWFGPGSGSDALAESTNWQYWLAQGNIWLNPPYSRGLQAYFIARASIEVMSQCNGVVVCLLPARTDTKLFHNWLWKRPNVEIEFLKGRLKFKGAKQGAPFPSMIAVLM